MREKRSKMMSKLPHSVVGHRDVVARVVDAAPKGGPGPGAQHLVAAEHDVPDGGGRVPCGDAGAANGPQQY